MSHFESLYNTLEGPATYLILVPSVATGALLIALLLKRWSRNQQLQEQHTWELVKNADCQAPPRPTESPFPQVMCLHFKVKKLCFT